MLLLEIQSQHIPTNINARANRAKAEHIHEDPVSI
jgi:hypothetical protein